MFRLAALLAFFLPTITACWDEAQAQRRPGGRRWGMVASDAGSFDALHSNARMGVFATGQSNALGIDNDGGSSMTDLGIRASGDGAITVLTEVAANSNESPVTSAANVFKALDSSSRETCAGNCAQSNTAFSGIAQGTTPYNRCLSMEDDCATFTAAALPSETYCTAAASLIHGENDEVAGMSAATYAALVTDLRTDLQGDFANKCLGHLPLFVSPHGASTELSTPVPHAETAIGMWLASTQDSRVCVFAPQYPLAWISNSPHLTAVSACKLGCYLGEQQYRYIVQQQGCLGLVPNTIVANGNVITMCVKGGDGSALALDTTASTKGAWRGFYFTDTQTDTPAISSVALHSTDNRCVSITLTRNVDCTASPRLEYASYGIITVDPGIANAQSVGGNVRDSDASTCTCGGVSQTLQNWLSPFRAAVTSCTGSAQSFTWTNTHSLDSNGAATNLLSARNPSDLNGQADATFSFWVRSNAASWPDANVLWTYAASGQRMFDFRTETTGGSLVRYFVSTTLSDASNIYDCDGGVAQTWQHRVLVKTGAALVEYLDGALNGSCAQTGSVPAVLTSPTRSTMALLSLPGASANFNGRDFAYWARALSEADVLELYCGDRDDCSGGAAPTNPGALSTGGALHAWPLNQTYEDVGTSATAIPLTPYGTGMTFEAIHP